MVLLCSVTAIDRQVDPGDPPGRITQEEHHGLRYIFGAAKAQRVEIAIIVDHLAADAVGEIMMHCLLYTSPSPRD